MIFLGSKEIEEKCVFLDTLDRAGKKSLRSLVIYGVGEENQRKVIFNMENFINCMKETPQGRNLMISEYSSLGTRYIRALNRWIELQGVQKKRFIYKKRALKKEISVSSRINLNNQRV